MYQGGSRALLPALVLSLLAATFTTQPAVAQPNDPPSDPVGLEQPAHGRAAVRVLGDRLDDAARLNGQRPAALRELLLDDPTAWLDTSARVYYQDAAPSVLPALLPGTTPAAYPLDRTFRLHSTPGSRRTIYLDFDGQVVSGTSWNSDSGVGTARQPAWSLDADPAFSDAERTAIQSIWQRVAEDYAPFDVDVTTQDPGAAALQRSGAADRVYGTRALITPGAQAQRAICGSGCGGVAYLDAFAEVGADHDRYQPAWIFPQQLGNDTKSIAESISHEVGHQLGLHHDGNGTSDYDHGHGIWAPIMGTGYDAPLVQWSKGDYAGATNHEDDLAVITRHGLDRRLDEAGGTVATAAAGVPDGTVYVSQRTDVDVYALGTCSGPVSVAGLNAPTSPDLDLQVRLLDAAGNAVATAGPVSAAGLPRRDVTTGTDATVSAILPAGAYFVEVDGVGNGSWTTQYDDYGSLGAYTLKPSGSCSGAGVFAPPVADSSRPDVTPPSVTVPSAPRISRVAPGRRGGVASARVRWQRRSGATVTGYQVVAYRLGAGRPVARTSRVLGPRTRSVELRLPRGRYRFAVRAVDSAGAGALSPRSRPVRAR